MKSPKLLAIGLGLLAQGFVPYASMGASPSCSRSELDYRLQWISGIEYDQKHNAILIADPGDPKNRKVLFYNPVTKKMNELTAAGGANATSLTKVQDGYLLKERDDVTFLGPDWQRLGKSNLRLTKSGTPSGLGSLYTNWITRGARFIGFGSVTGFGSSDLGHLQGNPARGFQMGFVTGRITANSELPRDVKLLKPAEDASLYSLGFPYFAATDKDLFYVRMVKGAPVAIIRVHESPDGALTSTPLLGSVIPSKFVAIPPLPKVHDDTAPAYDRFHEIEKSTMVAGLFGQGTYLYLLTREVNPSGPGTQWLLHQIDPDASRILGTVRLPTTAAFLSIAVAPDNWYFFERQEVLKWGEQSIKTVVRVPSAWIASAGRPGTEATKTLPCDSIVPTRISPRP
jgi:hypothetical protein